MPEIPELCDRCPHEWHGLPCRHQAVVRSGWFLQRTSCRCETSVEVQQAS